MTENRKKMLLGAAAALLCLFAAAYLFRAQPQNPPDARPETAEAEAIGVVDMRRAMREHPQYAALQQRRQEREALALRAGQLERMPRPERDEPAGAPGAAADLFRLKRGQAAEQKLAELNEQLRRRQQQLTKENAPAYEAALQAADDRYLPQIFNLQLKLDTLQVTPEAAEAIQRQMQELKRRHAAEADAVRAAFQDKLAGLMQPEQERARQEMDAHMESLDRALAQEARQSGEAARRDHLAAAEQSGGLALQLPDAAKLRDELAEQDRAIAALESDMLREIEAEVARVAAQHHLSIVLASVQVNVRALDITEFVVGAFKK